MISRSLSHLASLLIAAVLLSSCATKWEKDAFYQLQPGMSRAEVETLLGKPETTWQIGDQFMMVYDFKERELLPENGRPFIVVIENHRVIEYGAYERNRFPNIFDARD